MKCRNITLIPKHVKNGLLAVNIRETFSGISLKAAVKTKIHLAANVTSAHVSLPAHLQQLPVSHTQNITHKPASVAL